MSSTGLITTAIAGLGRSGWGIHGRLLEPLKDKYKITAVFDKDPARLAEAQTRFSCRTYTDYQAMLKDPEAELVVVAMPNQMHAQCSIDALAAGKHVACEKPMATSLPDADRMLAAWHKSGKLLEVFQNRRYSSDFQAVKRVIDAGVLGRIVHIRIAYHGFGRRWDWQTLKKYDGGSLNNTGPHPVDQALILFGDREPRVFCIREKTLTLGDAEDHVKLVLSGTGSPTVEVEIMSDCAYPQDHWLVMGTQGGLSGTPAKLQWKYFNPADLPERKVDEQPTPERTYNNEKIPFKEESWSAEDDKGPGETGFYLDLYESIRNGKPLVIRPEETRRQIWVMEECRRQAPI
jgi:predicted dehydrogenase